MLRKSACFVRACDSALLRQYFKIYGFVVILPVTARRLAVVQGDEFTGESQCPGFMKARPSLSMLGRRSLRRPAVASQTQSLPRSLRLTVRQLRNTNRGKTVYIATPAARIAPYLIYPVTDSVFRNGVFGEVIGEYFVFSAVDTAKSKHVPSGLSGLHRKTSDGGAMRRP